MNYENEIIKNAETSENKDKRVQSTYVSTGQVVELFGSQC